MEYEIEVLNCDEPLCGAHGDRRIVSVNELGERVPVEGFWCSSHIVGKITQLRANAQP